MVYEKTIDEVLNLDDDEFENVVIGPDRTRSKLVTPRTGESGGVSKPKLKRFSSELSMSPITLSSDSDDDHDVRARLSYISYS